VVVELGRFFETARIAQFEVQSVSLVGGWPEPEGHPTLTVLVGSCEVQARVVEKGPKRLRLVPMDGVSWPPAAQRAWLGAVRS
jgi:hypothetical protein